MNFFQTLARWLGISSALSASAGQQVTAPAKPVIDGTVSYGVDGALQLSAAWRCADLMAKTIATLPLFVYRNLKGRRDLARDEDLWRLLHEAPNSRMTPAEFWVALLLNRELRGNGYARIQRDARGNPVALWPMAADQVEVYVGDDGSLTYLYKVADQMVAFPEGDVLHLKGLGNGVTGLSRISYMAGTITEAVRAQSQATRFFENGNKPSGVLTIDRVLNKEQREALRRNFGEVSEGNSARLFVLEADMKWQQVSITPADAELLSTRQFTVEEICRWFGVPPVLAFHNNVTTWGSGLEQILEGWYKLDIRPMLVSIEQAITKRVLTPEQRARFTVEFAFEGLLRSNLKDRMGIYAQAVQNGIYSRNECRQLENMPPVEGGDALTAQTNLSPLDKLGQEPPPPPAAVVDDAAEEDRAAQRSLMAALGASLSRAAPAPVFNLGAPVVNLRGGDTAVHMPEGMVQLEAVVEAPQVTVEPAEVKVEAPVAVHVPPARDSRTTYRRDERGELIESSTSFQD
jgi:HK97 family phage portal protein